MPFAYIHLHEAPADENNSFDHGLAQRAHVSAGN